MKIALIGAGNVASTLGNTLKRKNTDIVYVWSHTEEHAYALAKDIGCPYGTDLTKVPTNVDVYLICVKDDALPAVSSQLPDSPNILYVHTAGNQSLQLLESPQRHLWGVLYPLQTFNKERKDADLSHTPLFLEANNEESMEKVKYLAGLVSDNIFLLSTEKRKYLHLAGVFSNNFTNYLHILSEELLQEIDVPFSVMLPIIEEQTRKLHDLNPIQAQTGPARRGDISIVEEEGQLLCDPIKKNIYNILSENILDKFYPRGTNNNNK